MLAVKEYKVYKEACIKFGWWIDEWHMKFIQIWKFKVASIKDFLGQVYKSGQQYKSEQGHFTHLQLDQTS